MKHALKITLALSVLSVAAACAKKVEPMAPMAPAPMVMEEPTYSKY